MHDFRFVLAQNPAAMVPPAPANPVRWITAGYDVDGPDICWSSDDEQVVEVKAARESHRHHQATVLAKGLGMTKVRATQGDHMIVGYVCVGALFSYTPDARLVQAPSQYWMMDQERPKGCPTYEEMDGIGVAWVERVSEPPYTVLNLENLNRVRGGDVEAESFFSAHKTEGGPERPPRALPPKTTAYAYAPDGKLWTIYPALWERVTDPSSDLPTQEEMSARNAALAWAPPSGFPMPRVPDADIPGSTVIVAVTCYVLSTVDFPPPSAVGATLYKVSKQS